MAQTAPLVIGIAGGSGSGMIAAIGDVSTGGVGAAGGIGNSATGAMGGGPWPGMGCGNALELPMASSRMPPGSKRFISNSWFLP